MAPALFFDALQARGTVVGMNEKRSTERTDTEHVQVNVTDIESGVEFDAHVRNRSAEGLQFLSRLEPVVGADLTVSFKEQAGAEMQVLRVERHAAGYSVAGRLRLAVSHARSAGTDSKSP